jgi:hypothetical protein
MYRLWANLLPHNYHVLFLPLRNFPGHNLSSVSLQHSECMWPIRIHILKPNFNAMIFKRWAFRSTLSFGHEALMNEIGELTKETPWVSLLRKKVVIHETSSRPSLGTKPAGRWILSYLGSRTRKNNYLLFISPSVYRLHCYNHISWKGLTL